MKGYGILRGSEKRGVIRAAARPGSRPRASKRRAQSRASGLARTGSPTGRASRPSRLLLAKVLQALLGVGLDGVCPRGPVGGAHLRRAAGRAELVRTCQNLSVRPASAQPQPPPRMQTGTQSVHNACTKRAKRAQSVHSGCKRRRVRTSPCSSVNWKACSKRGGQAGGRGLVSGRLVGWRLGQAKPPRRPALLPLFPVALSRAVPCCAVLRQLPALPCSP